MSSRPRNDRSFTDSLDSGETPLLILPGHDNAILGVLERFGGNPAVIYDKEVVLQNLVEDGMSPDEAVEWYEFNMLGAWVGENTPVYLVRVEED